MHQDVELAATRESTILHHAIPVVAREAVGAIHCTNLASHVSTMINT